MIGILKDKAYDAMLKHLVAFASEFVVIPVDNPRALSVAALAQEVRRVAAWHNHHVEVHEATTVKEGIDKAVALAAQDGVICACGSLYSVAEIKRAVGALTIK